MKSARIVDIIEFLRGLLVRSAFLTGVDQLTAISLSNVRMTDTMVSGEGVSLRLMTEADINERYLSWFEDKTVTHFLDSKNLSLIEAKNYFLDGRGSGRRFQFAVCDSVSGLHIGSVKLGDIDFKSRLSDLVTVIGDRQYWGKGIATIAIKMGSKLAFDKYSIRKLNGGIHSENIGSIKAYTRAGWVIEAILHSHHVTANGKLCDRVVVSCFNPSEYPVLPQFPTSISDLLI